VGERRPIEVCKVRLNYIIIGAGGHGRELCDWLDTPHVAFADDEKPLGPLEGHEKFNVRWRIADLGELLKLGDGGYWTGGKDDFHVPYIAMGSPAARKVIVELVPVLRQYGYVFQHRFADRCNSARIGGGTIMGPFSDAAAGVKIGQFVDMNYHSTVGHDCVVGDFVTLSPYVGLMGNVTVGEGAYFGVGAKVLPGVKVGAWAVIQAGAIVHKDVAPGETMYGHRAVPKERIT